MHVRGYVSLSIYNMHVFTCVHTYPYTYSSYTYPYRIDKLEPVARLHEHKQAAQIQERVPFHTEHPVAQVFPIAEAHA